MQIVRTPDGRLAHFADGLSPEELRRYIIPNVPDVVADPGTMPSAEQVPFDLAVPNLPSGQRLPGEINLSKPGMTTRGQPGVPEWAFHPFPIGDDRSNSVLTQLVEHEVNQVPPPSRDPVPPDRPIPVQPIAEPSDDAPITGLWENIGAGLDSGVNKALGTPVDLPVWVGNYLIDTANMTSELAGYGRPIPNIPTDLPGSSAGWERTQERLGFTPPSKVVPADDWQRLARGAADAVATALIPELLMLKFGQAATTLPGTADLIVEALYGRPGSWEEVVRDMGIEAAVGAATEWTPDWLDPYVEVLGLVGPDAAEKAATNLYGR